MCAGALHFNKNEEAKRGVAFVLALLILDIFLNLFFRGFSLTERVFLLIQAITTGGSLYVVIKSRFDEEIKVEPERKKVIEPVKIAFEEIFIPKNLRSKVDRIVKAQGINLLIKGDYGSGRSALARYIAFKRGEPFKINPVEETTELVIIEELETLPEGLLEKFPKKIVITTDKNYEAFSEVLEIPLLGSEDRVELIKFLLREFTFASDINWPKVAEITEGRALKELVALAHNTAILKENEIISTKVLSLALEKLLRYPA